MDRGSRLKKKRRRRLFSNIVTVLLFILAFTLIKDKLFPFIKNAFSNDSSDYVLADSDMPGKNDEYNKGENNGSAEGNNSGHVNADGDNIKTGNEKDKELEKEMAEKKEMLKNTVYINDEGSKVVTNPNDILVLVNKERSLASDYKPDDLVIPNVKFSFEGEDQKKYLRKEVATALEVLFEEAEKEDVILYAVSGYRSYGRQQMLFNYRSERSGIEETNKLTAKPGQSEHQTGLAMDVSSKSVNLSLEEAFGETIEGIWLKNNAHRFGFIIRYLKEKTDITGYSYEPWHIRYVGKEVAKEIYENNITFEEYLGFEYDAE